MADQEKRSRDNQKEKKRNPFKCMFCGERLTSSEVGRYHEPICQPCARHEYD